MKAIAITGGTGFIGRHVITALLQKPATVYVITRNIHKVVDFKWGKQVQIVNLDLHAPNKELLIQNLPVFDVLIHLAWPGLPNYQKLFHLEENLFHDYSFLSALIDRGLKHVIVAGTCFEYGLVNGCLNEQMLSNPLIPYALAKDTLRKMLQAKQTMTEFTLQWLRIFYLYGPGQSTNSILAQLDRAIDEGKDTFNMSGGEQLRDYLPVEYAAENIAKLVDNANCNGIINCCSGKPISIRNLVEQHVRKRNSQINLNLGHYPYAAYEPMAFWGDAKKIKSIWEN